MKSKLINLLQRRTSSGFIPEIDGLRFFAIFTVLIFHLNTSLADSLGLRETWDEYLGGRNVNFSLAWWIIRLDLGVKVFFAISGFVLALPFISRQGKVSLKKYFTRRLTRLEPPFVISMILFLGVHLLILKANFLEYLYHFIAGLFYLHVPIYGYPNPINPVTWSLETEAQFYTIVPLLFYVFFKMRSQIGRIGFIVLLFGLGIYFRHEILVHDLGRISNSVLSYLSNFVTGIILAWGFLTYGDWFKKKSFVFDLFGLIAFFGVFFFYKPQHQILSILFFNSSIGLLILSTFKAKVINWLFTRPAIYLIGGMCYSIYLLHYAFFHLAVPALLNAFTFESYLANLLFLFVTILPFTIVLSGVYFILFEKPFMNPNWIKNFRQKFL